MQRELKFRTWDTEYEEYSEWTNRDPFFSTSHGMLFFWERTEHDDGTFGGDIILQDTGNRFILEQYTGILDKNGKEIYEGDILKFPDCMDDYGFINGIIEWEDGCFGCRIDYDLLLIPFVDFAREDLKKIEILGNIHENPELLK